MKVLSLAIPVLACAIAFAGAVVPAHAQWSLAYVTFDPSSPAPIVHQSGNATVTYSQSSQNMEVTATTSGSSPANGPTYMGMAYLQPIYDANFAWSGGGTPDTQFTFTISGDADGYTEVSNCVATAKSAGGDSAHSVGGIEGPVTVGSWDDAFPPATEQTVTVGGTPTPSTYMIEFDLDAQATTAGGGSSLATSNTAHGHAVVNLSF